MSEQVSIHLKYSCKICNKQYSSCSSLCNHNKRFHKTPTSSNMPQIPSGLPQNASFYLKNECSFCNKIFSRKDNLQRHKKTCKLIDNDKIEELEKKIIKYDEKNKELENTIFFNY